MNLIIKILLFTLFLSALGGLFFLFRTPQFYSTAHPLTSYSEALTAFRLLEKEEEQLPLSQEGHSRLLTHQGPTDRVFVLLHGLSNCPEQMIRLGEILFESGANVLMIRARYAGFSNLLNKQQAEQSGEDLLTQAATGLDIAAGLGVHVSLVTISASGLAGAWMAQHRPGISQVLIIAPFFGAHGWPVPLMNIVALLLSKIPNFFIWKPATSSSYIYPRYGTHCLGKTLLLARAVRSFEGKLQTDHLDVLLSEADHVVNNKLTQEILKKWVSSNPGKIMLQAFPAAWKIPHDCLDPNQDHHKIEKSYPVILKILKIPTSFTSMK